MPQSHQDPFVEMLPALSDSAAATADAGLTVFEYLRVVPGASQRFTTLLATSIRPFETRAEVYVWSESGRMLISDGWDFVRIHGVRSLADWQRYRAVLRSAPRGVQFEGMMAARKTVVVRGEGRLSVR